MYLKSNVTWVRTHKQAEKSKKNSRKIGERTHCPKASEYTGKYKIFTTRDEMKALELKEWASPKWIVNIPEYIKNQDAKGCKKKDSSPSARDNAFVESNNSGVPGTGVASRLLRYYCRRPWGAKTENRRPGNLNTIVILKLYLSESRT